ncbi:hypothetical protein FKW77_005991 [Venturia effusa]|uniref:Uncharacterized protein n=1 Tax=Venturia effusa TaxID=50376 RepID=A0A517LIV3_9PEZI|nr:hypothetical protein FKW77_005991 [Venturia effusa]
METGAAVAGVVSTFETGANLVQQIRKRSRKRKGEQAIKEKLLQEALEAGEKQISELYSSYLQEAGTSMQIGDAASRDRLQHIAVTMQSELVRSLQIALKFENAKLDLTKLQEDAVMSKRDTMSVLDELRRRVQQSISPQLSPLQPQYSSRPMSPDEVSPQRQCFPPQQPQLSTPQSQVFSHQQLTPQNSPPRWNKSLPPRPSNDSMTLSFRSLPSIKRQTSTTSTLPSSVGELSSRSGSGLSRFLSARRNVHKRESSSSSVASSTFATKPLSTQETLVPEAQQTMEVNDPHHELPAAEMERPLRDYKASIPEPEPHLHPALNRFSETSESNSASTRISGTSDFSGGWESAISVEFYEDLVRPPMSPHPADIASALPPSHSQLYSSSYPSSQLQPTRSPTLSISTASMLSSPIASGPGEDSEIVSLRTYPILGPLRNSESEDVNECTYPRPMSVITTAGSTYSEFPLMQNPRSQLRYTNDSMRTMTMRGAPRLLTGRPDRSNNYWGFCKGAWTIRSQWRKGLTTYEVPTGMYNSKTMWRCKHCTFEGDAFGPKKPFDIDQRVYQKGASGVQYRWLFLAKSHTKRKVVLPSMATPFLKDSQVEKKAYGCVFCVGEGKETAFFGEVEMLCDHLLNEHGTGSGKRLSENLMTEIKCITGRKAGTEEDFDVNIPHVVEIA